MITIEAVVLSTMALVFIYTFMESARSHSRRSAWAAPANLTPIYRPIEQLATSTGTLIDAQDRFAARRTVAAADTDVFAEAA